MANTAPAVPPAWAPGQFQILFVSMGQGDCCVVTCPDGAHIMIDCGSKGLESWDAMVGIQSVIRSRHVLNLGLSHQNQIEALILTHPDLDHISKVREILGGATYQTKTRLARYRSLPVNKVYFSDYNTGRQDYASAPLRIYGPTCSSTLRNKCRVKEMYCVTLKAGTQVLDKWTRPFDASKHVMANHLIANNRVTVRSGILAGAGTPWEVSIIAGNVARQRGDKSDTDGRNAASLVTLVSLGNDRALICGDATRSTENYLYTTYQNAADISAVTLLQVPHHGSGLTSSTNNFVGLVKPQHVAISVQKEEHSHHLPGADAVGKYVNNAATATKHPVPSWRLVTRKIFDQTQQEWIAASKAKKMTYREELDSQGRTARYVRTDAAAAGSTGPVILDGFNKPQKYMLYQQQLDKEIRQTGLDQHLWHYFP